MRPEGGFTVLRLASRGLVLGAALALVATAFVSAAQPQGNYLDPSDEAKIRETFVWIPAGDHQIPGIFAVPRAGGVQGTYPAVLMLHGSWSHKDEVGNMYKRLARALAARGYASLRIDFAGSGDSQQEFLALTRAGSVADARTALDWLVAQPQVIPSRVGVQGFSRGTNIAATLVGTDTRVAAFGSWSGTATNGTLNQAQYDACVANGGHLVLDVGFIIYKHGSSKVDLSCDYFTSNAAGRAADDIAAYANPILIIAGTLDTATAAGSRKMVGQVQSLDATLRILPGADHTYLVLTPDQTLSNLCITLTADWYAEKL
jgi:dienelactone hydrolase